MNDIGPFLQLAIEKKASDLYFTAHAPVMIRIEGDTYAVGGDSAKLLAQEDIAELAESIMTPEQQTLFRSMREIDFAIRYKEAGRFRVNVFRQRGSVAMVLRSIGSVPKLADLKLPAILPDLVMRKRGLILCVGATGSGKSTTLAAMIDHSAHLVARDFAGLLFVLTVVLVDDARADRDTWTPHPMTKCDKGFVHLEIVVAHPFIRNYNRAF
jgi:twitching motility protein PilU